MTLKRKSGVKGMECVILAGGKGTRMNQPVPKPLVVAAGKPILEWQLEYLLPHTSKIILALSVGADQVCEWVEKRFPGNEKIVYSIEPEPLGTGGALKLALQQTHNDFVLVLNADNITDIPIEKIPTLQESTIFVARARLPYGLVKEENGYSSFVEKPLLNETVSIGWYWLEKKKIEPLLPTNGSLETDVFPTFKMRVSKHEGKWCSLDSLKDVLEFEKEHSF